MCAVSEISYLRTDGFTDESFARILEELSPLRREKAERCRVPRDAYASAAAGWLLDRALKKEGLCERDAVIVYGKNGKPYLKQGGVYFNLSHSGEIAVCAVSHQEVGVDIQKIKPVSEALVKKVCSERELVRLSALSKREREEEFCRLWTLKESVMKWSGEGLALLRKGLEIDFSHSHKVMCGGSELSLCLKEFALHGYKIAVCTARKEDFTLTEVDCCG